MDQRVAAECLMSLMIKKPNQRSVVLVHLRNVISSRMRAAPSSVQSMLAYRKLSLGLWLPLTRQLLRLGDLLGGHFVLARRDLLPSFQDRAMLDGPPRS